MRTLVAIGLVVALTAGGCGSGGSAKPCRDAAAIFGQWEGRLQYGGTGLARQVDDVNTLRIEAAHASREIQTALRGLLGAITREDNPGMVQAQSDVLVACRAAGL